MQIPRVLIAAICTTFFAASSFSQGPDSEAPACNSKVAQMLVEQQITESKSVVARPKRVKILLRSADFLWPLDQPAARGYFVEAFATAKAHFSEKGFERADVQKSKSGGMTYSQVPDLRNDVIRAVGKYDRELAKKFADEVLAEFEKSVAQREGDKTREQDDLLRYAGEIAGTDPELARQLYRRLMKYPLGMTWFMSLISAARQNQPLADAIYGEALQNYRNENPSRLLYLSPYPFGAPSPFGRTRNMFTMTPPPQFVPNVRLQRAFLDTFFARIASFTSNPEEMNPSSMDGSGTAEGVAMSTAMQTIEPIIIERFPDLLERFGSAVAQANSAVTAENRKEMETFAKRDSVTALPFEERIAQLEEAESKGALTDTMLGQFIFQANMKQDDQFKAFEPWIRKIKDEKLRTEVSSYFYYLRSELATKERRFADGEKWAAKVPELEHRSVLLFAIVKAQIDSASDASAAFEMLNSVSKLARSAPNSVAKIRVLFSLSEFYERVNHSTALDELGEAVRVTNQMQEPDIFTNFISRRFAGPDFAFMASIALPGGDFEKMFTALGNKNFEMALANARGFDDKYFRTIATIAVAKNCIQPKPAGRTKR